MRATDREFCVIFAGGRVYATSETCVHARIAWEGDSAFDVDDVEHADWHLYAGTPAEAFERAQRTLDSSRYNQHDHDIATQIVEMFGRRRRA